MSKKSRRPQRFQEKIHSVTYQKKLLAGVSAHRCHTHQPPWKICHGQSGDYPYKSPHEGDSPSTNFPHIP